jgi:hypothetical protein
LELVHVVQAKDGSGLEWFKGHVTFLGPHVDVLPGLQVKQVSSPLQPTAIKVQQVIKAIFGQRKFPGLPELLPLDLDHVTFLTLTLKNQAEGDPLGIGPSPKAGAILSSTIRGQQLIRLVTDQALVSGHPTKIRVCPLRTKERPSTNPMLINPGIENLLRTKLNRQPTSHDALPWFQLNSSCLGAGAGQELPFLIQRCQQLLINIFHSILVFLSLGLYQ